MSDRVTAASEVLVCTPNMVNLQSRRTILLVASLATVFHTRQRHPMDVAIKQWLTGPVDLSKTLLGVTILLIESNQTQPVTQSICPARHAVPVPPSGRY